MKSIISKRFLMVLVGTVAAIGLCTMSFGAMTGSAKEAAVNKTQTIPTTYPKEISDVKKPEVPDGYKKADYKVKLEKSANKAVSTDISAAAAAETGSQDLFRLFAVELSGKTIEMSYIEANDCDSRAQWQGMINVNETLHYWFNVDAVTGECRTTGQEKYWKGNISTGFDSALNKNPEKYATLAKSFSEKFSLVSGKIVSTEYGGQGYMSNNAGASNPDITMIVVSDKGEKAQLNLSRYNQELLTVSYDNCVKDMEAWTKKLEQEQMKKIEERKKSSSKSTDIKNSDNKNTDNKDTDSKSLKLIAD